ncbi:MAG TPA: hypothetical protein VE619_10420 [Nitrososphaeraceae archaeon]|nr:hypothetical protein [Nitrososphaeraceae archaeon]
MVPITKVAITIDKTITTYAIFFSIVNSDSSNHYHNAHLFVCFYKTGNAADHRFSTFEEIRKVVVEYRDRRIKASITFFL